LAGTPMRQIPYNGTETKVSLRQRVGNPSRSNMA
jgi:hypothetical protein